MKSRGDDMGGFELVDFSKFLELHSFLCNLTCPNSEIRFPGTTTAVRLSRGEGRLADVGGPVLSDANSNNGRFAVESSISV